MGITYKKGKTMKTKIPFLFDLLFLFAASFLLVLALSGWIMPRVPGFLTAFAAAGLLTLLCYRVRSKKELAFALRKKDEKEAEALADRVGILSCGKLMAVGTPQELTERTGARNFEDAFVALANGGTA